MTSAGSGIFQMPPELFRPLGGLGVPDGVERFIVEILHEKNLAIAAQEALIFLQRDHHDPSGAVTLDTHGMKHGLVRIISELTRDLLGRDRQKRLRHVSSSTASARSLEARRKP